MKVSFDDGRRKLVACFNDLAENQIYLGTQYRKKLDNMRSAIAAILCMEDEREQPEDCNCLIDRLQLTEIDLGGDES